MSLDDKDKEALYSMDKRVSVIEEILCRLEHNHLQHMEKDLARLDAKVWALISGMALQLASFVAALLLFLLN